MWVVVRLGCDREHKFWVPLDAKNMVWHGAVADGVTAAFAEHAAEADA